MTDSAVAPFSKNAFPPERLTRGPHHSELQIKYFGGNQCSCTSRERAIAKRAPNATVAGKSGSNDPFTMFASASVNPGPQLLVLYITQTNTPLQKPSAVIVRCVGGNIVDIRHLDI